MPTLVAALKYAEARCRPKDKNGKDAKLTVDLKLNKFTREDGEQLRKALPHWSKATKFQLQGEVNVF